LPKKNDRASPQKKEKGEKHLSSRKKKHVSLNRKKVFAGPQCVADPPSQKEGGEISTKKAKISKRMVGREERGKNAHQGDCPHGGTLSAQEHATLLSGEKPQKLRLSGVRTKKPLSRYPRRQNLSHKRAAGELGRGGG